MADAKTANMGLQQPSTPADDGQWGTVLNANNTLIDAHDHTSGKGELVPSGGINHNANESHNNNGIEDVDHLSFNQDSHDLSDTGATIGFEAGEFVVYDGGDTRVQMTAGGLPAGAAANIDNVNANKAYAGTLGPKRLVTACDTTGGAVTITLPSAGANPGLELIIKDKKGSAATHSITVAHGGADTIDLSSSSTVLNTNFSKLHLISDGGTNWMVV